MKRQSGLGLIGVLLALLVLGLAGFAGWNVWQSASMKTEESTSHTQTTNPTPKKTEKLKVEGRQTPNGYTLYENKTLGFSFYYPQGWGGLSPKTSNVSSLDLEGPSVPITDHDNMKLTVWSDKTANFVSRSNNRGTALSPVAEENKHVWKYATDAYGLKPGDTAKQQPELLSGSKGTKIYKIAGGHACAAETMYLFPAGENFVGVMISYSSCYGLFDGTTQEKTAQFEKSVEQLKEGIAKLPLSIEAK